MPQIPAFLCGKLSQVRRRWRPLCRRVPRALDAHLRDPPK
jgi:hypothetical protein